MKRDKFYGRKSRGLVETLEGERQTIGALVKENKIMRDNRLKKTRNRTEREYQLKREIMGKVKTH